MESSATKLSEELILLNLQAVDRTEALNKISQTLIEAGMAKDSFEDAIIEREKIFPTGLQGSHIGVALPHTDSIHVIEQSMAVAILDEPVEFIHMGSEDQKVNVKIIFMLAIKEAHSQLEMLQKMIELIQNEALLDQLSKSKEKEEVLKLMIKQLEE